MNKYYATYLYLIPVFVLIQVLILNEILFFNYINPYLYLSLIISLPLKTPKWFILIYAFTLGLLIDIFGGSLGFHSTATVFIAFLRHTISKITIPHNILADHDQITLSKIGNKSFITFALIIIIIHNCSLFILEHLELNIQILGKIILSSILTLILLLILEIFRYYKK